MAKKTNKKKSKLYKNILSVFLVFFLLIFAAAIGATIMVVRSAPEIDINILDNLKQSVKFYDSKGNFIASMHGGENRSIVSLKQIPEHLQKAYISIEDERFYSHHGVDIKRIFGAILANIKSRSKAQGGSTITQQLVKNYALTQEKSYIRKIQEMYLAVQLERKLSKDQILEGYLNTIYLGPNVYGVSEASRYYFGKSNVQDISIAEAAFLAAITQNPGMYNPYSKKNKENPSNYINRQKIVLKKMLENGYISQKEYEDAINEDIVATLMKPKPKVSNNYQKYQWFIDAAIEKIVDDMSLSLGISEKEARQRLISGGYKVYLTMDSHIQEEALKIINEDKYYKGINPIFEKSKKDNKNDADEDKKLEPQAAAVVMDLNGEVKAIIGGRGNLGSGAYNYATVGKRPPGSSIKPLSVYAPAIENKVITAATIINDSKDDSEAEEIKNKTFNRWFTSNYDDRYSGPITVRKALQESKNTIAVKILDRTGLNTAYKYVTSKFGLSTLSKSGENNDFGYAALALGQLSEGAIPLEMAAAYTAFANNGIVSEPILYTKVEDRNGNVILEKKSTQRRALSPETAYIMNQLLMNVLKPGGTGTAANLGNMPAGGKTGTASSHSDGWFVGFTPYYTCAVWIGPSGDNKIIGFTKLTGAKAAPIWKAIMLEAHKGLTVKYFEKPDSVVATTICSASGKLATDSCINKYTEFFIAGTEPSEYCNIHSSNITPLPENPENNNENLNNNTDTSTQDNTQNSQNSNQNNSQDSNQNSNQNNSQDSNQNSNQNNNTQDNTQNTPQDNQQQPDTTNQ